MQTFKDFKDSELRHQDSMCVNESEKKETFGENFKYLLIGIGFGIVFVKAEIVRIIFYVWSDRKRCRCWSFICIHN